jgi:hypothetical protein
MKEYDFEDLDRISSELAYKIKNFVRSYELKNMFIGGNQIKKDAELMYVELREAYNLDIEECEKVDSMFAKKMIFDVDLWKLRTFAKKFKKSLVGSQYKEVSDK